MSEIVDQVVVAMKMCSSDESIQCDDFSDESHDDISS